MGATRSRQGGRDAPAVDAARMAARAEQAAQFLRTLASPHRLMILCALAEGELSVGVLAERVGIAQPNVSQHLFKLKAEGLVAARRDAQTIHYRLASDDVRPIIAHLYAMFCGR
jgi:DNA-binding transcriptional ArsR family regulator